MSNIQRSSLTDKEGTYGKDSVKAIFSFYRNSPMGSFLKEEPLSYESKDSGGGIARRTQ